MLAVVTTIFAVVANIGVVATQMVAGLVYLEIVPEQDGVVGQVLPDLLPKIATSVFFMLTMYMLLGVDTGTSGSAVHRSSGIDCACGNL